MKKLLITVFFILMTCYVNAKYVQIVYLYPASDNISKVEGAYLFENENLKILYSFWDNKGQMGFIIYNKSDKPLYIDWKKSCFIRKGERYSYYSDKEQREYFEFGSSWTYTFLKSLSTTTIGNSISVENIVKPERITFIPPRSFVMQPGYIMLPWLKINAKGSKEIVSKQHPAYVQTISKEEASIVFRNFITYSFTDNFEKELYIDNAFYVGKILTFKNMYFEKVSDNGREIYSEYENARSFYLKDISNDDIQELKE